MRILYEFRDDKGTTLQFHDRRKGRLIPRVGDSCLYWRGQNAYTLRVDAVTWDFNIGAYDVTISGAITRVRKAEYNDIKSDSRLYPIRNMVLDALLLAGPLATSLVLMYLVDHYYLRSLASYIRLPLAFLGTLLCWLVFFFFMGGPLDSLADFMIPKPPREVAREDSEET